MPEKAKKVNKKRVLVFGTFDILHPGHLFYLQSAKRFGQELCVIVARNETVKKIKGKFPVMDEKNRLTLIEALKPVNKAVLGCKGNMYKKIKELNPDVICLGYDQRPAIFELRKELSRIGLQVKIYRLKGFHSREFQSSKIKKKIKKRKN